MSELFRKKPVVISAVQFHQLGDHPAVVADPTGATGFGIHTLEHTGIKHEVTPGDWIITGIKGEVYACKPDIFAATYEAYTEPDDGDSYDGVTAALVDTVGVLASVIASRDLNLVNGNVSQAFVALRENVYLKALLGDEVAG